MRSIFKCNESRKNKIEKHILVRNVHKINNNMYRRFDEKNICISNFALVVLNVFLWGVLVINNLNEKTTGLMKLQLIKTTKKLKKQWYQKQIQKYRNQKQQLL